MNPHPFPQDLSRIHNFANNADRQKAYTFNEGHNDKNYIMEKYMRSLTQEGQVTNYANIQQPDISATSTLAANRIISKNHHQRQASRLSQSQLHRRTHQQHYYQTMHPHHTVHPSFNIPNNYYNLTGLNGTVPPPPAITGPRHSPMHDPPPLLNNRTQLDCITVMQVCNELGNNIDQAPPMPRSRQYSIVRTNNGNYKVAFPQTRIMTKNFHDQHTKLEIKIGEVVSVLGPSREDRSKFTICYKEQHIDVQHQYTSLPI